MGVIHKLKNDVIDFIVQEKKTSPFIGCRQLADMVSNKFQTKISKSSVNEILKNAQLSSPVGRRVRKKEAAPKFEIPPEKKKQIQENLQQASLKKQKTPPHRDPSIQEGFSPDKNILKKELERLIQSPPQSKSPIITSTVDEDISVYTAPDENLPLIPDPLVKFEEAMEDEEGWISAPLRRKAKEQKEKEDIEKKGIEIDGKDEASLKKELAFYDKQLKNFRLNNQSPLYPGMGYIFLKIAEWEVFREPILSYFLKRHLNRLLSKSVQAASQALLYLNFLGEKTPEELARYNHHGLLILNGLRNIDELNDIRTCMDAFSGVKEVAGEFSYEVEQSFIEAKYIKVFLEDKSVLVLDAFLSTFSANEPDKNFLSAALAKSLAFLSKYLISNNKAVLFSPFKAQEQFPENFYTLAEVFNNTQGKKIDCITVYDAHERELARFSLIPAKVRSFCIGLKSHQKEFEEIYQQKDKLSLKIFHSRWLNKVLYYDSFQAVLKNNFTTGLVFKAVVLFEPVALRPNYIILTNDLSLSDSGIITDYLARFPIEDGRTGVFDEPPIKKGWQQEPKDLNRACLVLYDRLNAYCQRHFFFKKDEVKNINLDMPGCYDIPGRIIQDEKLLNVVLYPPQGFELLNDLILGSRQANQRMPTDFLGRRVLVTVNI